MLMRTTRLPGDDRLSRKLPHLHDERAWVHFFRQKTRKRLQKRARFCARKMGAVFWYRLLLGTNGVPVFWAQNWCLVPSAAAPFFAHTVQAVFLHGRARGQCIDGREAPSATNINPTGMAANPPPLTSVDQCRATAGAKHRGEIDEAIVDASSRVHADGIAPPRSA